MNLSQKEITALKKVVDYVLSYTKAEYDEWNKGQNKKEGHVYYWAELLNKSIWEKDRIDSEEEEDLENEYYDNK